VPLHELARTLDDQTTVGGALDMTAQHIQRLIPCSLCVFYLYDAASDELDAPRAIGNGASAIRGVRIAMGGQLSGWVAANRQTMINADPILDLGEVARTLIPPLRSSLATPLVSDNELVGVVTVHSATNNAFTDDHRTILEAVATQAGRRLSRLRRLA
jgi:GAF domain-containing protein